MYTSRAHKLTTGVHVDQSLTNFCVIFLFLALMVVCFIWSSMYLPFFNSRLLITSLVSSHFSYRCWFISTVCSLVVLSLLFGIRLCPSCLKNSFSGTLHWYSDNRFKLMNRHIDENRRMPIYLFALL